jgi:DNA-binding transcriptional LysR family regulator
MVKAGDWDSRIGRRVRLRDLHILMTVLQRGSMAQAAAHLGISQPAVSEAIADLEAAIGVRLLDRRRRGVEPTSYGATLQKYGRAAFDELRQGIKEIELLSDPTVGEVRVACPEIIAAGVLVPIIERFSRQYPKVTLRVMQANTPALEYPELHERNADLTLARLAREPSGGKLTEALRAEVLFNDRFCVVAGPRSQWARCRKIDLEELANSRWIMAPADNPGSVALIDLFRIRGLEPPKFNVTTNSVHLRNHLVGIGSYITALPESVMRLNAKKFGLKTLPIELPLPQWLVGIVTLAHRPINPTAQRFIDCAREVAKSIVGRPPVRKTAISLSRG